MVFTSRGDDDFVSVSLSLFHVLSSSHLSSLSSSLSLSPGSVVVKYNFSRVTQNSYSKLADFDEGLPKGGGAPTNKLLVRFLLVLTNFWPCAASVNDQFEFRDVCKARTISY